MTIRKTLLPQHLLVINPAGIELNLLMITLSMVNGAMELIIEFEMANWRDSVKKKSGLDSNLLTKFTVV
jgi:hypothetical protein